MTNSDAGFWMRDGDGHGTHVAGTIAAVSSNSRGVAGINSVDTPIHIVRALNDSGSGSLSDVMNAARRSVSAA